MRKMLLHVLILNISLALTPNARAGGRDEALTVIERAIVAHGGAGRVAQTKSMMLSIKGEKSVFDKTITFTSELTLQLPDKYRSVLDIESAGQKIQSTTVINGDK